jgi:hypothetical protein
MGPTGEDAMALRRSKPSGALVAVLTVLTVLLMAACGGDDSDAADPPDAAGQATDADAPDDEASDSESGQDGDGAGPGGLEAGTARVTIGDMTWEGVADQCLDFGVALAFVGQATDDPEISISLDANTDDPSANSASVDLGDDGQHWRAGAEYASLGATVPEVTAANGYGTGTATFANVRTAEGETAEGTYEFFCG